VIAAAVVRHRQGGFLRVRLWVGDSARSDRNAWVKGRTARPLKLTQVPVVLSMGSAARTAFVTVDGADLGVRDVGADWRRSLATIAENHRG
jgi:hypothetical protein